MFLNLEDETGLINVICTARRVEALPQGGTHRARVARSGVCSRSYQGVTNVLARRIVALPLGLADPLRSRDFH